jgi:membrane-bound lytic murein transglycosylase B
VLVGAPRRPLPLHAIGLAALAVVMASVLAALVVPVPAGAQSLPVQVDSPGYRAAVAALEEARSLIANGEAQMDVLVRTADELALAQRQIQESLPGLRLAEEQARAELSQGQADLRRLAAAQFVHHGTGSLGDSLLQSGAVQETQRGRVLLDMAGDAQLADVALYQGAQDEAEFQRITAEQSLADVTARLEDTVVERDTLAQRITEAAAAMPQMEEQVQVEHRLADVVGTDLPYIALEAYVSAANGQAEATPGCALHWSVLAGIGRVESNHGRYGGTRLDLRGTTTAPIIGIALTGDNETANIPDTDGGGLDGDSTWDRAVGPMQFIPTTWVATATDGDGDGAASPHNIYDAARTAARYLCRSGNLGSLAPLRQAILTYNLSNAYVDAVLGRAAGYQQLGL